MIILKNISAGECVIMYNQELKNEYLQAASNPSVARVAFNAIQPYEVIYGGDVCTMSEDDLTSVLNALDTSSTESYTKRKVFAIRNYREWCVKNGVPGAVCEQKEDEDRKQKADPTIVRKIRSETVSCPAHLQQCLNKIFRPESDQTVDDIYRAYCWMAYAGIRDEDLLKIKTGQIDLRKMVIHYGMWDLPIYREAVPAFVNAVELDVLNFEHPIYRSVSQRPRVDGDEVFRTFKRTSLGIIDSAINKKCDAAIKKELGENNKSNIIRISRMRLRRSGIFYYGHEEELKTGTQYDFVKTASMLRGEDPNTVSASTRQRARILRAQYLDWKTAWI